MRAALGEDNAAQADAIVDEIADEWIEVQRWHRWGAMENRDVTHH